jgi:hypothetical protein
MLLLLACSKPEPIAFCESEFHFTYNPDPNSSFTVFPDDHWTKAAATATGLQINMSTSTTAILSEYPDNFVGIFDELSTLDGFGLSSGIWFRADEPLPELTSEDVLLYANGKSWPVELKITDGGQTVMLLPLFPLPENTEVTALVKTDPKEAGCFAPSAYLKSLLDPATEDPPARASQWQSALSETGVAAETIAAMTVFTTQSATRISRAVADNIHSRTFSFGEGVCFDTGLYRECDVPIELSDYRQEDHIVSPDSDGTPVSSYSLPVRVWLPLGASAAPYPVVMCGHGLGGDRSQCTLLAEKAAPLGTAVVAMDAVEHGDHPGRTESSMELIQDLMIFAISIDPPGLNALRLRDNFRQSAWDKLQVLQGIRDGLDADNDGIVDLDGERVVYAGVSLGSIMGPEPLALDGGLSAGVLVVGGGRISSIIQDSPSFSILVQVMRPPEVSDGDVDRFFPVLQTILDGGDPMVFGAEVFEQENPPHVLSMLAFEDQIVPNSSNEAQARGLELPGVGAELWPIEGITFGPAPVSANRDGKTVGLLEYSMVQEVEGGEWIPVEHDNLHESVQGMQQILDFIQPVLEGEVPVILEPERP